MRKGPEAWILGVLLLAFILATVVFTRQSAQEEERQRPSSYNADRTGTRALFELLSKQGLATRRFEKPLTELPGDVGLLVMIEPLDRPLQAAEANALNKWLESGGSLLFVGAPRSGAEADEDEEAPRQTGFEEAAAGFHPPENGPATVAARSPFSRDVSQVKISGASSVDILKPEKVHKLVTSGQDVFAVTWREKKGRVVFAANSVAINNEQLSQGALDNPIFLVNIAQESVRPERPVILFDEYHHGFGERRSVGKSFWGALGPGLRAATWYLLFGFLLLIYALNRRFGSVKTLPSGGNRPSTEYIASMAALYQRAGAGVIAVETILHDFLRQLSQRLEMETDAPPEQLAEAAQKKLGWDANELAHVIRRCSELVATPGPVTKPMEQEITQLAQRLHAYRTELSSRKI